MSAGACAVFELKRLLTHFGPARLCARMHILVCGVFNISTCVQHQQRQHTDLLFVPQAKENDRVWSSFGKIALGMIAVGVVVMVIEMRVDTSNSAIEIDTSSILIDFQDVPNKFVSHQRNGVYFMRR